MSAHDTKSPFACETLPCSVPSDTDLLFNYHFAFKKGFSNTSRKGLFSNLPDRPTTEAFIEVYLQTIEKALHFLDLPAFESELVKFWNDPDTVDDSWLGQFFAILSIGCHGHDAILTNDDNRADTDLPHRFMDASQVCLKRTPFMCRPNLANVRTICLMVISKQVSSVSCHDNDTCWALMGLIVRLAMGLGLHIDYSNSSSEISISERKARKDLWASILFLEMRQALLSGMPLLLQPSSVACEPETPKENLLRYTLNKLLPAVSDILRVTYPGCQFLEYEKVMEYDTLIRRLFNFSGSTGDSLADGNDLERILLTIFGRRLSLALHSHYAQEPLAFIKYPVSYWSSLESCLALLAIQQDLCKPLTSYCKNQIWFSGLFTQDFFTAAVTLCFHVIREGSPLELPVGFDRQMRARTTVLETLKSCRDMWKVNKFRSLCSVKAFNAIDTLTNILEKSE